MSGKRRHRGFGHIRRLPSKRYQASFVGLDALRHNAPSTFTTRADAEAWLEAERRAIGVAVDTWTAPSTSRRSRSRRITFGEYAERWIVERDLKPRTIAHYRTILKRFLLPAFENVAMADITPARVATWHAQLDTGRTYRAHAYSLLRTITRAAVADRVIPSSPCVIRKAGRVERAVTIKTATLDELRTIIAAMPADLRPMVLLATWCALRFGELAELRRSDVDLSDAVVHVRRGVTWVDGRAVVGTPKSTAGTRDVAIPPHLLPMIATHLRDRAQTGAVGLMFPSPSGQHLTSTLLYKSWWPAREAAGRPDLRFHDLRHTGAVLAAQAGATLAELMARLGHSTPSAAMRYQHAARDRDAEIARRLSALAT